MRVCRLCYLFIHSLPCTPWHLDVHLPSFLGKHKGFSVFSESLKLIKQTPQNGYHYLFNNKHKSKLEASCHLILVNHMRLSPYPLGQDPVPEYIMIELNWIIGYQAKAQRRLTTCKEISL